MMRFHVSLNETFYDRYDVKNEFAILNRLCLRTLFIPSLSHFYLFSKQKCHIPSLLVYIEEKVFYFMHKRLMG